MQSPSISLNSEQLDSALLQEVEVVQALNDHWTCRLVLRDTPDRRPPVEDFAGKPLRISTTDLLGVETIVFRGFVRRMRVIHEVTGAWGAELDAISATWKMAQGTSLRYFKQQTAQAVAQSICETAGVPLSGAMPAGPTLSYAQWDETDLQFVLRLVDDVESWLRPAVDDTDGLDVETSFQSGTTVNWREGEYGLLEWVARGRLRPTKAAGANYDPQVMRSSVTSGVSSTVPMFGDAAPLMVSAAQGFSATLQPLLAGRNRSATLDDMQQRMQREARRGLANTVLCTGISRNPAVRAGDTLTVTGLPEVDATYGVIRAVHRWTTNGYENEFTATPAERWSPAVRPAPPQMDGVYPARVIDNHDPHNQGRIRVQYYWQQDTQTTWVRLLTPHAGAGRGMLFLPELGEEVLICFEEGDVERPYAVGSLWNGVHQPPAVGFHLPDETNGSEYQKNYIKRMVTKSGHRLTVVDTPGRESISLATPDSNRILLTESHADTGNRPAIVLESQGDIVLASPKGRHHQQAMFRSADLGAPAAAPGKPTLPKKLPCGFLKKGFRVNGSQAQFNQNRAKAKLGPAKKVAHVFPGGKKAIPATQQTATIDGHDVTIYRADQGPVEKGTKLPSNQEVANSLAAVPSAQLAKVNTVTVSPLKSPDDAHWAQVYHTPNFRSEADCGADGKMRVFPISQGAPQMMDATAIHESGHTLSKTMWDDDDAKWKPWQDAMKADGASPSQYADASRDEDFSESLVMYTLSKGTVCEQVARILFPHRYAMLDQILHPPPPPPPKPPQLPPHAPPPKMETPSFWDWLIGRK